MCLFLSLFGWAFPLVLTQSPYAGSSRDLERPVLSYYSL